MLHCLPLPFSHCDKFRSWILATPSSEIPLANEENPQLFSLLLNIKLSESHIALSKEDLPVPFLPISTVTSFSKIKTGLLITMIPVYIKMP